MAWTISNAMMKAYENSLCSQELVAESSEVTCSDGVPSALSNTTPMPDQFYWPDKTTEHSRLSRFGMTCEPLTESHGEDLLTWFRGDFPARTLAQQEKARVLMESEADSGAKWQGSFAKFDRDTSLWKTAQCSLLGDLELYLETWPRWGSMRNGASFLRPIPALHIFGKESGFVPNGKTFFHTLNCHGLDGGSNSRKALQGRMMLPTLCAGDYRSPNKNPGKSGQKLMPSSEHSLPTKMGGQLHPTWCEWFMAFPIGWTELKPLAMRSFQEWQQQHGKS